MSNIQQMMRQAQELQAKMKGIQEKIAESEYEGTAGGGAVRVTVSGKGDMRGCQLDDNVVDPKEKEVLEDLIVAAYTHAKSEADNALTEEMSSAGISPDLMNFG